MDAGITFEELLAYTEEETLRWKKWFAERPQALDRACDVAGAGTVRNLLQHIFATELFFAHRVLDLPPVDPYSIRSTTLEELFSIGDDARKKFREFFARAQEKDWHEVCTLSFRDFKATKRKLVAQAMWHGINHRGQLATFLRQQGFDGLWTHDLLLSKAME
jgi:uncharacterized damage-inducible protein DinB